MAGIQQKPVGVFWDIENCSVPRTKSPSDIIAHIRNSFVFNRLNHREFEFIISCDVTRLRKDIPEDINKAGGVTLAHVSGNSKNAADEKLRENMKKFVDTHVTSVSPVLILISGDSGFVNDLRGYQTRLGCTIILIHAPICSEQFKIGWNETYCFMSFCSAVKDNPTANKQLGPPIQKNHGGQPNQKNLVGRPNQKYQDGAPFAQYRHSDQKAQPENIIERPQRTTQFNQGQKERYPRAQNSLQHQGVPFRQENRNNQQGASFGQGNRNSNNGPNATYVRQQHLNNNGAPFGQGNRNSNNGPNATYMRQQHLNNNGGSNPSMRYAPNSGNNPTDMNGCRTNDDDAASAKYKFILMVGGLPGKMDFKILKENLQLQANEVQGKVKYVKNGQAFITFRNKANADRAVELFNGRHVFGKTLNVSFTKSIPFEDQSAGKLKSVQGSGGFVVVEQAGGSAGRSKSTKNKDGNNKPPTSNDGLGSDPVFAAAAGLESLFRGIEVNQTSAPKPAKSPDFCPIQ